ncbi:peptidoglycan recognition protein family protein [Carnobacterium gallinarum]|uniref:peptidoglycan recognition protein family protein n=1 Tax=Carnobacterium gallinarum TaxID=2749 RepID=UPI0006898ED6
MLPIQRQISRFNFNTGNNIQKIVIHDVGTVSTPKNNADYFGGGDRQASAHYFVDGFSIYQVVEDSNCAWHVGDGSGKYGIRNNNSIGIEQCLQGDGTISEKTKVNTLELTKYLQKKYGISDANVVRHYDASRKICPRAYSGNNWALWWNFKERLTGTVLTSPTTPVGQIRVGSQVTVAKHASAYAPNLNGKQVAIASFVRGSTYKVLEIANVNFSNSKRKFLLDGIMSWVLEQDIIGGQSLPNPNQEKPTPAPNGFSYEKLESGFMYSTEDNWVKRTPTKNAPILEWHKNGNSPIRYHKIVWNDGLVWLQLDYWAGGQAYVAYADAGPNNTFGRKYGYCE